MELKTEEDYKNLVDEYVKDEPFLQVDVRTARLNKMSEKEIYEHLLES